MLTLGPEICHVDRCPHGCTSATGCGGHEQRRLAPAQYAARLGELIAEAARWGVDLRAALASRQDVAGVPLSEQNIIQLRRESYCPQIGKPYGESIAFARAIERAHGIGMPAGADSQKAPHVALAKSGGATQGDGSGCRWAADADGIYETSCGNAHIFTEGTPAENSHRWCCYCGRGIVGTDKLGGC